MGKNIYAYFLLVPFAAGLLFGFAHFAYAAMAPSSRLVTTQTDGIDANYIQPYSLATTSSFMAFAGPVVATALAAALLYGMFIAMADYTSKTQARMHSRAMMRRRQRRPFLKYTINN